MSLGAPKAEKIDGKGLRIAICRTRWNGEIVERLASEAIDELSSAKAALASTQACEGAFELAPLVARVARKGDVDGIIAIGCLIRGETDHYALLAGETTRALGQLALELATNPRPVAITFGVLACESEAQARERAFRQEKGREFARTCIAQAQALRRVGDE